MQQRVGLGDVAHIGGSGDQRMGTSKNGAFLRRMAIDS
jgi:hypothetical protein